MRNNNKHKNKIRPLILLNINVACAEIKTVKADTQKASFS